LPATENLAANVFCKTREILLRFFTSILICHTLIVIGATGCFSHDLKHLPLGDDLKSSIPKAGHLWPCRIEPDAGGAFRDGPWIDKAHNTFDKTAKPVVHGDVRWPHSFTVEVQGTSRVFTGNNLPDHGTGIFPIESDSEAYRYDRNPNAIAEQTLHFNLPANPQPGEQVHCAPGAVGILLNGIPLFSAIDAPGRDAVAHEVQDTCDGHPQVSGVYHYHNASGCVADVHGKGSHSALIGYAIDGFGIFGNDGDGGRPLTNADLDECHGHIGKVRWDGKLTSIYHYHATPQFPYTVGCLRGQFDRETVRTLSGPPPGWFFQ
jgi:YHYH protein